MTCGCESSTALGSIGVGRQRSRAVRVGKLQRANPIPAGMYWIDVVGEDAQVAFSAWIFENASRVEILVSQHFRALNWPDCLPSSGGIASDCSPSRDWVKFRVSEPAPWDAKKIGFPNIIEEGEIINSSEDTGSIPDFSDNCDIACQAERIGWAVGGVLALGVLFMVVKR